MLKNLLSKRKNPPQIEKPKMLPRRMEFMTLSEILVEIFDKSHIPSHQIFLEKPTKVRFWPQFWFILTENQILFFANISYVNIHFEKNCHSYEIVLSIRTESKVHQEKNAWQSKFIYVTIFCGPLQSSLFCPQLKACRPRWAAGLT